MFALKKRRRVDFISIKRFKFYTKEILKFLNIKIGRAHVAHAAFLSVALAEVI